LGQGQGGLSGRRLSGSLLVGSLRDGGLLFLPTDGGSPQGDDGNADKEKVSHGDPPVVRPAKA
jgi:hypothetical protein